MTFITNEVIDIITKWTNDYRQKEYRESLSDNPLSFPTTLDICNNDQAIDTWFQDLNTSTALTTPLPYTSPSFDTFNQTDADMPSSPLFEATSPTVNLDACQFSLTDCAFAPEAINSEIVSDSDILSTLSEHAGTNLTLQGIEPTERPQKPQSPQPQQYHGVALYETPYEAPSANTLPVTTPTGTEPTLQPQPNMPQSTDKLHEDLLKKQRQQEAIAKQMHDTNLLIQAGDWLEKNVVGYLAKNTSSPLIGKTIEIVGGLFSGFVKMVGKAFEPSSKTATAVNWVNPQNNQIQKAIDNMSATSDTVSSDTSASGLKTKLGHRVAEQSQQPIYPHGSELTKN